MKRTFRDFKIQRTCTKKYEDYHSYHCVLREDFQHRCAYCNLLDSQVTTPFEIDHFVPKAVFRDKWPELENTYENLVYTCKKCNLAKSNQYKGNIDKRVIENELFYDPEKMDYGAIFYRGENGGICSDDPKGRDMITRLKLYRPIHNLAWICEITQRTLEKLSRELEKTEQGSAKEATLREAKEKLNDYYNDCRDVFIANYNNNKFTLFP